MAILMSGEGGVTHLSTRLNSCKYLSMATLVMSRKTDSHFIQTVTATWTDGNTASIEFITKFPDVVKA